MTKKKVILLAAAALFAVSGLTALPSGNITGGVGCIVVAAVSFSRGTIRGRGKTACIRTEIGGVRGWQEWQPYYCAA